MNQPSPPRSVPGPASIPRIRSIVTIQVTSDAATSPVAITTGPGPSRRAPVPIRPDTGQPSPDEYAKVDS